MIKSPAEELIKLAREGTFDQISDFLNKQNENFDINSQESTSSSNTINLARSALHILSERPESDDTMASLTMLTTHPKIDLNSRNYFYATPLHSAVSGGKKEFCRILLEAGADKFIRNDHQVGNRTPEELARSLNPPRHDIADFIRDFQIKDPLVESLQEHTMEKTNTKKRRREQKPVPDEYIDPITLEIMEDPVITPSGITYDRKSIETWLEKSFIDPQTRAPLTKAQLVSNLFAKATIERWRKKHDVEQKSVESTTTSTRSTGEPPCKRRRFNS